MKAGLTVTIYSDVVYFFLVSMLVVQCPPCSLTSSKSSCCSIFRFELEQFLLHDHRASPPCFRVFVSRSKQLLGIIESLFLRYFSCFLYLILLHLSSASNKDCLLLPASYPSDTFILRAGQKRKPEPRQEQDYRSVPSRCVHHRAARMFQLAVRHPAFPEIRRDHLSVRERPPTFSILTLSLDPVREDISNHRHR